MKRPAAGHHRNAGATLAELLFVVLLISVFASVSFFALRDSLESQRLNAAATALSHEFSNLSLQAVRLNRPIEIRFLKNDPDHPGLWSAMQAWTQDAGSDTDQPLGPLFRLGEQVTLSDSEEHSGILRLTTSSGHEGGFSFHPRGGTDLPKTHPPGSNPNCITLIPARLWTGPGAPLPALHRTLCIHPTSGKITLY